MFNQKGISSIAVTLIVAIVVIGGGFLYIQSQSPSIETPTENGDARDAMENDTHSGDAMTGDKMENNDGDAMEAKDGEAMSDNKMGGDSMKKEDGETMSKAGSYEDYDAAKVASAAKNGKAVLFFHAKWCPTCRGLNSNIESNRSQIPDGVTIFKVDYDTQTELKKKYGVTYQHTMVQVDANGDLIAKWGGSPTLSDLVSKIQ